MRIEQEKEESVASDVDFKQSQKSALQTVAQPIKFTLKPGPPLLIDYIITFKACILYFPLPSCYKLLEAKAKRGVLVRNLISFHLPISQSAYA